MDEKDEALAHVLMIAPSVSILQGLALHLVYHEFQVADMLSILLIVSLDDQGFGLNVFVKYAEVLLYFLLRLEVRYVSL